jgi:hypothetical protein
MRAGRCIDRFRFTSAWRRASRKRERAAATGEFIVAMAATPAGVALFAPAVVLHDHADTLQRTRGRTSAASTPSERATSTVSSTRRQCSPSPAVTRASLLRTCKHRFRAARFSKASGFAVRKHDSIGSSAGYNARGIAHGFQNTAPCVSAVRCGRSRAPHRQRFQQCRQRNLIGIGEAGLLAAHRAHAHALLDRMRTVLDDAVFHRPALMARMLEIQIGEINARAPTSARRRVRDRSQPDPQGRADAIRRERESVSSMEFREKRRGEATRIVAD